MSAPPPASISVPAPHFTLKPTYPYSSPPATTLPTPEPPSSPGETAGRATPLPASTYHQPGPSPVPSTTDAPPARSISLKLNHHSPPHATDGDVEMADGHASPPPETSAPLSKGPTGISLVFKVPPGSGGSGLARRTSPGEGSNGTGTGTVGSRASSPGTTTAGVAAGRTAASGGRGRKKRKTGSGSHLVHHLSPDSSAAASPAPSGPVNGNAALEIFQDAATPALPRELQDVVESSASTPGPTAATIAPAAADGDGLAKDAAEGFENRLRSTRGRESAVRRGVDAQGRVKVESGGSKPERGTGAKRGRKPKNAEHVVPNQDFCSSCRGIGRFLCCDGCPRSFHFMCLEPPLLIDELPGEESWYCKKCQADRNKTDTIASPVKEREREIKPIPSVFKMLIRKVDEENPEQFRLPEDIRTYFAGVTADPVRGTYINEEETRTRMDRKGFQEERDGTRLRDGKRLVSCYKCGGTSMPLGALTTDPGASWRQIISCDHCALHWHLDCLSPPMAAMPNSGRKWMCPNHVEQAMARRRTLRTGLQIVDVESAGQANNGNIQVMPDEDRRGLDFEDLVINKKKYRVPEKIIKLDFWEKLRTRKQQAEDEAKAKAAAEAEIDETESTVSDDAEQESTTADEEPWRQKVTVTQADLDAAQLVLNLIPPSGIVTSDVPPSASVVTSATPTTAHLATPTTAQPLPYFGTGAAAPDTPTQPSSKDSSRKIMLRVGRVNGQ